MSFIKVLPARFIQKTEYYYCFNIRTHKEEANTVECSLYSENQEIVKNFEKAKLNLSVC